MGIILPTKKVYSRTREVAAKRWVFVPIYISSSTSPNGFHVATWDSV